MTDFERLAALVREPCIEQGVLLAELNRENFAPEGFASEGTDRFQPISNLIIEIIVLEGTIGITVDNIRYECTPQANNLIDIKPLNTVTEISPGDGFRGCLVSFSRQFMDNAEHGSKPVPFYDILPMRLHHTVTLGRADLEHLAATFRLVQENAGQGGSPVDSAIFQHAALLYLMKVLKMMFTAVGKRRGTPKVSRSAMLCNRFSELLVSCVEREHEVEFYAGQLSITSHYLTKITREYMGLPANKVIARELVTQALVLLRNPDYTLQEIADRLNFSDQSSFGKFFKRHTGKTPAAYRREATVPIEGL